MDKLPLHPDIDTRSVEIVMALPEQQIVQCHTVDAGTTARGLLLHSGLMEQFPTVFTGEWYLGIFGKKLDDPDNYVMCDGDRVEVYRPLLIDPQAARRQRAANARNKAGGKQNTG